MLTYLGTQSIPPISAPPSIVGTRVKLIMSLSNFLSFRTKVTSFVIASQRQFLYPELFVFNLMYIKHVSS